MIRFIKKYHKWIGLFFSFFIILSALSGIVLNHRKTVSGFDISRNLLPKSYRYNNWNNGSIKGSFKIFGDSVLIYGGAGVWLTDSVHSYFTDFNAGLKSGADNRTINRIVQTHDGSVYAVTTFDLYKLNDNSVWEILTDQSGISDRISDMTTIGDSLIILTRSEIYVSQHPFDSFTPQELKEPADYNSDVTIFRTLWLLHSGALFGLPGKLFVDLLGIIMIILSATGVIYAFFPGIIKRGKKRGLSLKKLVDTMKTSIKWHNKIGVFFVLFLIILVVSGMFLRPPLMIPIIRSKTPPIPGSILNNSNPWLDKLRSLKYDYIENEWLLYTSSGFYTLKNLNSIPKPIDNTPPVSVMGVTVLEQTRSGWFVGSFSGLYHWNRNSGTIIDCYNGTQVVQQNNTGRPIFDNQVSGYAGDFSGKLVIFEYDNGARTFGHEDFAPMPQQIRKGKISLWHTCLEIHVGRAYRPLIGPFSDLFVFLFGFFTLFILLSGYIIYRRRHRKAKDKNY